MSKLNKFMALLVVIFSFLALMQSESKACDLGYSSITRTIMIEGCAYRVFLCVKCPTGPSPGIITIVNGFEKVVTSPNPCENGLTAQQVFNAITNYVCNYSFIEQLCDQLQAPPCGENPLPVTYRYPICWKKTLVSYFGIDHIYYEACDYDTYCLDTWQYCYDSESEKVIATHVSGPTLIGNISCTLEYWNVADPLEYNQPTSCFKLHTACNP